MKEKLIQTLIELLMKLDWKPLNGNGQTTLIWQNHKLIRREIVDKENL